METHTPSSAKLIVPAAFALACAILTLLALHIFGAPLPLEPQGYRVVVPLPDASNLVTGSDVQSAGVKIGEVVRVKRTGTSAQATIELQPRYVPLRDRATAITRTKTLLGEGYVELAFGPRSARAIRDGGRLSRANVRRAVQLDEFLASFGPATRRRLHQMFGGLSRAVAGRAGSLNDSLGRAAPFAANLREVLSTVQSQHESLRRMIASSADVLHAFADREGVLQAAVTAGNDVLGVTGRRNRALAATVHAFAPFLRQLQRTSNTISAASPDLNGAVTSLVPVAPLVRPALDAVNVAAPDFRTTFRALPATIAAGRRGLPALPPMLTAARRTLRAFYPASRELIPFMQLFAADRNALYILANVAAVNSGSFVAPNGQVLGYATGLPTTWNETISGWRKKLPTNRQNPYPKPPDALLDTGRIGVLKSYDCRNTGNPLYLPPTGTGAPPCILQGPWTFNGKSRFYPRLELAPR